MLELRISEEEYAKIITGKQNKMYWGATSSLIERLKNELNEKELSSDEFIEKYSDDFSPSFSALFYCITSDPLQNKYLKAKTRLKTTFKDGMICFELIVSDCYKLKSNEI